MKYPESVVLSGTNSINPLGVLRGLGRKGISIILLDIDPYSMARYSRFVSKRVPCPNPQDSEMAFIEKLVKLGRRLDRPPVYIPTGDAEVLALSKYKEILSPFFRMPVASFETINLFVNKKRFFQDLIRRNIPCPRTCFPETVDEMRKMAAYIGYPLIVKSAYSHVFIRIFHKKVFVVHSPSELESAAGLLNDAGLDYFLQEIIPGSELYLFYAYFNRQSIPLGICGYDKIRQRPKDFGIGTICRSINRFHPIQTAIRYLQNNDYFGIAEPEFKLDPRDGLYKMIEINPRSVTQTLLAATCGAHIEYLAYQDLIWGNVEPVDPATEGLLWIDEISELHYFLSRIRRGLFSFSELSEILKELLHREKYFACASMDDPVPFFFGLLRFCYERFDYFRNEDVQIREISDAV